MHTITNFMANDHRSCDHLMVAVEQAVASGDWALARTDFGLFQKAMQDHFEAEESLLFPLFEQSTGMYRGPTQVMRGEQFPSPRRPGRALRHSSPNRNTRSLIMEKER